jgi:hypothetical protein
MKIRTAGKNWRHNKTRWQKQRVFACQGGQTSFPAAEAEHAVQPYRKPCRKRGGKELYAGAACSVSEGNLLSCIRYVRTGMYQSDEVHQYSR